MSQSTRFQNSAYYRTIIDNNIFRPLGWKPTVLPTPVYHLSGTIISTNGKSASQAFIQESDTNKTYIVTIGENLTTNTKVIDIKPKQVTLEKAGEYITLQLDTSLWLNGEKR